MSETADVQFGSSKRLATIPQMPNIYPAFTIPSLRWLIFNQKENGFTICIRRIGRKILIDLDEFENWVDQQGGKIK